jgi:hypothetical protein
LGILRRSRGNVHNEFCQLGRARPQKPPEGSIASEDPLLGELLAEFFERQVWGGLKCSPD